MKYMRVFVYRYYYFYFCLYRIVYKLLESAIVSLLSLVSKMISLFNKKIGAELDKYIRNINCKWEKNYWYGIGMGEADWDGDNMLKITFAIFIINILMTFNRCLPDNLMPCFIYKHPLVLLVLLFVVLLLTDRFLTHYIKNDYIMFFKKFEKESLTCKMTYAVIYMIISISLLLWFLYLLIH